MYFIFIPKNYHKLTYQDYFPKYSSCPIHNYWNEWDIHVEAHGFWQSMNTSMLDDSKRCPHVFNSCRHSENKQEIINDATMNYHYIYIYINTYYLKTHFLFLSLLSSICFSSYKRNELGSVAWRFVFTHNINICFSSWCMLCFTCFLDGSDVLIWLRHRVENFSTIRLWRDSFQISIPIA
jgi:hypothetical protein